MGFPHIPDIENNLLRSQFHVTNAINDISNFYTNNHLDVEGSLLSAILLQEPQAGSKYPSLNPERKVPLILYLYMGSKFGYIDT